MNFSDEDVGSVEWGATYAQRFVYDGWTPVLSYRASEEDGSFLFIMHTLAWGPDLSASQGGAGGIGGLAILTREPDPDLGLTAARTMWPVYDGNGNVTRMCEAVSGSPVVVAGYEYGPFGEVRSITGVEGLRNPIRWSTKWTDNETGLVYYGYRYYSASTGRWLNRDPIDENGGVALGTAFMNNPVSQIDPDGRLVRGLGTDAIFFEFGLEFSGVVSVFRLAGGFIGFQRVANCTSKEISWMFDAGVGPSLGITVAPPGWPVLISAFAGHGAVGGVPDNAALFGLGHQLSLTASIATMGGYVSHFGDGFVPYHGSYFGYSRGWTGSIGATFGVSAYFTMTWVLHTAPMSDTLYQFLCEQCAPNSSRPGGPRNPPSTTWPISGIPTSLLEDAEDFELGRHGELERLGASLTRRPTDADLEVGANLAEGRGLPPPLIHALRRLNP